MKNALAKLSPTPEILLFDEPTATAQQAAERLGCELGQIVKSMAFIIDGSPILVLISGSQRASEKKLAAYFNINRKRVKIATPQQCIEIYGYAPGSVPPVGLRTPNIPVYIDDTLAQYEMVYAAGGTDNSLFGIPFKQLQQLTNGTIIDVKRD
ncbi:MAG: YbaK/EbsC family protein [Chloroflexi bacterium]|nr:MAG: YbaK/EbsC family protein [Chloroflexota bacterium]